jgi:hypothetical protein
MLGADDPGVMLLATQFALCRQNDLSRHARSVGAFQDRKRHMLANSARRLGVKKIISAGFDTPSTRTWRMKDSVTRDHFSKHWSVRNRMVLGELLLETSGGSFCSIRMIRPGQNPGLSFLEEPNKNLIPKRAWFQFSRPLAVSTVSLTCQEV